MEKLNAFRPWFYAAALYNALWGAWAVLWPDAFFRWVGLPQPNYPSLWQCVGMVVGVFAFGYWLIARDPVRYGPFVYVGLLGKLLGPIGFVFAATKGELPWSFGWINLTNDLIWLPAFTAFAYHCWKYEKTRTQTNSSG